LRALSICLVGPAPPIQGGIAQHSARLAEALHDRGHTVSVLSWRSQYPRFLYRGRQVDTAGAGTDRVNHLLRWWNPISWWRAGRIARGSDVLVMQWVTPFHSIPLRLLMAAAGRQVRLAVVHNPMPHERLPMAGFLTRLVLRKIDGALVHGEAVADELAGIVAIPRVVVVPHPPNLNLHPERLPSTPPSRLLFMGYVRHYKGPDLAIEAIGLLREAGRDVHLTVAGEFWEPVEEYADLASRLGVTDHVDLRPGYVADEDIQALLGGHHLVVAPYRSATQSGIAPLAFAVGRPVVTTRVGSLAEVVIDGVTGTLAPPDDLEGFVGAVERALDDMDGLAQRAQAVAVSWSDVAGALVSMAEGVFR